MNTKTLNPALFLILATLLTHCQSPANDQSEARPLYTDVTATHLPPTVDGYSMDARPTDVDADGDLDIIVACEFCPNLLLINDGKGRFTDESDARLPRTKHDSEDIAVADFDGDGDPDIVIVSEDDEVNEFYLNDGRGVFSDAGGRLPVTGTSNAVLTADLNGDGYPDLLIGNNGQNRLLLNGGEGNFTDETATRLPAVEDVTQDLELGDVDGDGDPDLIVGNEDANRLLLNDGTGRFTDETLDRLPGAAYAEETREADFGDVDGDGDLDLLFANISFFTPNANPQNRLLLNDGTGHFSDVTADRLPASEEPSFDGDFFDLDDDGDLDIITSNTVLRSETPAAFSVYLNDGNGFFTLNEQALPPTARGNGFDAEFADFNGDGKKDLYLASRQGMDRLLFGKK